MAIKWKFPTRTATVHCSGGCRAKRDENGGLLCAYGGLQGLRGGLPVRRCADQ